MAELTIEHLSKVLEDVVARLDQLTQIPPNHVQTYALDMITHHAGLLSSGEFRSGNNKEPGRGFTGVRLGYPGFTYDGELWQFAGVLGDALQVGIKVEDGKLYAGEGAVVLDRSGLKFYNSAADTNRISFQDPDGNFGNIEIYANTSGVFTFRNAYGGGSINSFAFWLADMTDASPGRVFILEEPAGSVAINVEAGTLGSQLKMGVGVNAAATGGLFLFAAGDGGGQTYIKLNDSPSTPPASGGTAVNIFSESGAFKIRTDVKNPAFSVNQDGDTVVAGSLTVSLGGADISNGHVRSHSETAQVDDSAISFTPSKTLGVLLIFGPTGDATIYGMLTYNTSTPAIVLHAGGSNIDVTTGTLSGTTGADTRFTVSCHTDGKIYVENRRGGNRTWFALLI